MKFPKHILLDVKRPLVPTKDDTPGWQKFYYHSLVQSNHPLHNVSTERASTPERLFVTQSLTYNLYWDEARSLPFPKISVPNCPTKYYLPKSTLITDQQVEFLRNWLKKNNAADAARAKLPAKVVKSATNDSLLVRSQELKKVQFEKNLYFKSLRAGRNVTFIEKDLRVNRKFCYRHFTVDIKSSRPETESIKRKSIQPQLAYPHKSSIKTNFDINFLLREWKYSKLKYSKTAERDIVSSGSAALFAGFIGFLISEKFGIELVDSGDFYFLFMYCVFGGFSLKVFFSGLESNTENWNFSKNTQVTKPSPYRWINIHTLFYQYVLDMVVLLSRFVRRVYRTYLTRNIMTVPKLIWTSLTENINHALRYLRGSCK